MTDRRFPGLRFTGLRGFLALFCVLAAAQPALAQTLTTNVSSDLGAFSTGELQYQLIATGGNGTYSWDVTAGALPPGVALRTDKPSWFSPSASAGLIGVPTVPGRYNFTLRVQSGALSSSIATGMTITTLNVNAPFDLPDALTAPGYSYTLTPLNNAGAVTWAIANATLPPGLNLNTATGVIAGTPTTPGFYSFTYSLSDGTNTIFRGANIRVSRVKILSTVLANATQNEPYGPVAIDATGGTGAYTYTQNGGMPVGLSMSSAGVISGTTTAGQGRYAFTVTVTDSANNTYSKNVAIFVDSPTRHVPVVRPYGGYFDDCTLGTYCRLGADLSFGGTAPFVVSSTGLPTGVAAMAGGTNAATFVAPGDIEVSGVATATGSFSPQLQVTDGIGGISANAFPLHVSRLAQRTDSVTGVVGTPYSVTLRIIGGTGPYHATLVRGPLPAGLTFDASTLTISGTPTEAGNFGPLFDITDNNGEPLKAGYYFSIQDPVSGVTINNYWDLGAISSGSFYSTQLSACCVPVTWSVAGGALPPGFTLSTGGLLSGSSTSAGIYKFILKAADTSNPSRFDVHQFQLTISFVTIQTSSSLPNGFVGSPYSQDLVAQFGPGTLTWTLDPFTFLPAGLSLVQTGLNQWKLSGTPTAAGQFNFRLLAVDGTGIPNSRYFQLFVFPAGATPTLNVTTGSDLGRWMVGEVEAQLFATGGTGVYNWQLVGGSLPTGVSVRQSPELAPWFSPGASAGVIGIATVPGPYSFTLRVTSGSQTVDVPFTMTISSLASNDPFSIPSAFVGEDYSFALTASGNSGAVTWTLNGALPPGLSLSSAGVISGKPTTAGFYNISYALTDGTGNVFRTVSLPVFDLHISSSGALANGTVNVPYLAHINVVGGTAPYHFDTSNSLPAGLALDPTTGDISGTPTTTGLGRFTFTVTVTDANRVSYSKTMAIVMIPGQPSVTNLLPYGTEWEDCAFGVYCSRGISAFGGGKAPFTWTVTGLPAGLAFRFGDATSFTPGDLEIYGVPRQVGTFAVHVTMTDADDISNTNDFPLRISRLYMPDGISSGTINQPYFSHLRTIGGTPPYTGAMIGGILPAGMSFDGSTLDLKGTPLENGSFSIVVQVTDAAGNKYKISRFPFISAGTSTVSISSGDLGFALAGQNYSSTLFACCLPNAFTWSLESGTPPTGLTLASNGTITGTVDASNAVGPYKFLVRAADSINPANFAIKQITITVSNLQITSGNPPTGNVGTPFSFTPTATGGSGTRTWSLAPFQFLPLGLTLNPNTGEISGTPTGASLVNVTLRVSDTGGNLTTRGMSIAIYPSGVYPPLTFSFTNSLTGSVGTATNGIFTTSITGGLAPYQLSLTPGSELVPGMRLITDPALTRFFGTTVIADYAGVLTTPGVYHPSIRVTDANGTFIDHPFTFVVLPFHLLSPTTLPKATRNVPYSYQLVPFVGGANLSWTGLQLPAGLSVDAATGLVSGTPTVAGATSFRVLLTDLTTSTFNTFFFNITIDPFAITTSALLPTGAVGTPYSASFSAPDCGSPCNWTGSSGNGLTMSSAGVLSGTPTGAFNGTFTVTASGPNGVVSKLFSLVIAPTATSALTITTTGIGDVTVGSTVTLGTTATGGTAPYTWSLDAGTLPNGVWFATSGADYSANLGAGFPFLLGRPMEAGTYNFTIRVTDSTSASATRAFTWNVSRLASFSSSLPAAGTTLVYNQGYTQPLLVLGGTGSYPSWTNLTATPAGLALNPNSGLVSGTPTNTGSITTQVRVADSNNNTFTGNWTFNIAGPTATTLNFAIASASITVGTQFSASITPTNGTAPYTVTATGLPPGMFVATAGDAIVGGPSIPGQITLSGIPTTPGVYQVTLQAQDSAATPNFGAKTIPITIASAGFLTTNLPDASVGHSYLQPLVAFDATGPITWSVSPTSGLPPGFALDPAGALTGTPTQVGTFSFVLNLNNSSGLLTSRTFNINVSGIFIQDPTILPVGVVGVAYTYPLTMTGGAGTVVWSAASAPPGLTLSSLGVISGTPTSAGLFTLTATATDGVRPTTRQFTVPIRLPIPPLLDVSLNATKLSDVVAGAFVSLILNANNGLPPYSWRVAGGSSLPPGLQLLNANAASVNFVPGTTILSGLASSPGAYSFDLIATDAAGTEVRRTYTLNVTRIGLLTATIPTVITGTQFTMRFAAVGGTGPYTFTASPVSGNQDALPPGFTLSSGGQLSGPTNSTGLYSFSLRVQDSAGNNVTRNFTITVTNPSGLRVLTTNPPDLWVGGGLRGETDLDVNGASTYTWTLTAGALPPGLHLDTSIGVNNTELVGAPTTPGTYTFTLRATDNANASNFAEHVFTVRVGPMQIVSPPVALLADLGSELPSGRAGVPYSFTLKAAGGTAPYSFAQSPFVPLPAGLTLSSSGVISGMTTLTGRFVIAPVVTDAAGRMLNSPGMGLVIAPAGARLPLVMGNFDGELPGGSAGVPFTFPIDRLIRTGAGPFTWTLATATPPAVNALPPGMMIVSGSNGTDSYLAGTPTTPGEYSFTLTVSDSSAPQQSVTVPFTMFVSRLALTPGSLPPGKAGSPYSQTIVASGGTGPYSVNLYPPSDLPVGMTFSGGVLSGTPTSAGNYLLAVIATDAGGDELFQIYRLAVDNALGEAPALALAPKPIQIYYEIGSPTPPPLPIVVSTTSGAQPFSLSLTGVPSASLSATTGTTTRAVTLNLNVASLGEGTYRGLLAASAPGAANIIDEVPVSLTIAKAPNCTFTAVPAAKGATTTGGASSFTVSTGATCNWTALASNPWIHVTSGSSGTGTAAVNYSVDPNPGSTERTGTISVNGVLFTITQYGATCSYTLNPASVNAVAAGGQAFIGVLAPAGCPLTPSSFPTAGLAQGPPPPAGKVGVNVVVAPNAGAGRTLTATISGQPLLVFQAGIECTAALSPYSTTVPAAGTTGSVGITLPSACGYNTVLGPNWITVTSGATGAGDTPIVYSVAPNPTTAPRSGTLTIGGQPFVITQEALACSVTVDTSALGSPYGANGGTGSIAIAANGANCSWTASSNVPWAILAPTSETGSGTIGVTITSNAASATGRTGTLTVGGQTINIAQAGTTCTFELGSDTGSAPAAGGAGNVRVTAPAVCGWTASSNAPWLSIVASGSGGTSDVRFAAQANASATPRTGTLTIANTPYTVNQSGATCAFTITGSATSPTFASDGAGGQSFGFTSTIAGCAAPVPVSYASWITVDATSFSGTAGSVTYSALANPFGTGRSGTIQVGSATFTVVQSGSACAYSLNEYGHIFHSTGGDAMVLGSPTAPACTPATGTNQPSFITLGTLAGPDLNIFSLPYTVAPFTPLTPITRFGSVTFGGQVVLIKQYSW